ATIAAAPNLKIIARVGVGYDAVDVEAATRRGIWVTTTPGANSETVADFTFGLILGLTRQIARAHLILTQQRWPGPLAGVDIHGKTLGLVGTGRIGQAVARRARGFDMRLLAHDVFPDQAFAAEFGAEYLSLDDLLRRADVVSLHVPYSEENHYLIDERRLALMPPSAYLVNTARGGLVDEAALYRALAAGRLAGAALDCHESEPRRDYDLAALPNVVLTPHQAGHSAEAYEILSLQAAECVLAVLTGNPPPAHRVVNRELLEPTS
ncbi:MAG: phosphoglycerate dehydrogenase, partial [Chloroflexi bacterium]|nr:phosphoglycerate dehydrogenase [Chloroflexota bacterium]